ncbi:MAG: hypothetical protein LBN39_09125, partial [Planctomycetaceae bacterium]|nr:hypothetical protein [Planctomycetaceae bacterium]
GRAAETAAGLIKKILDENGTEPDLYNINIPVSALQQDKPKIVLAEMDLEHYWETFEKRLDPMGRAYYWLSGHPDPRMPKGKKNTGLTDMQAVAGGCILLTPLQFDRTNRTKMEQMKKTLLF